MSWSHLHTFLSPGAPFEVPLLSQQQSLLCTLILETSSGAPSAPTLWPKAPLPFGPEPPFPDVTYTLSV